jgi:hypothetical protein
VAALGGGLTGLGTLLPGAQQILALAYLGPQLEVLEGTTPPALGLGCCSRIEAVTTAPGVGAPSAPRRVLRHLSGPTEVRLVGVGTGLLAVIGNENGVWVAQAGASGTFRRAQRLAPFDPAPPAVAATAFGQNRWLAAWSTGAGTATGRAAPATIHVAIGGSHGITSRRVQLTLPAGHVIDQLAAAADGSDTTVAFLESWYDRRGAFHARAEVEDLGQQRPLAQSAPGVLAAGLSLAAAPDAGEVLAWQACDPGSSDCSAQASVRAPGGAWSAPSDLGPVDAAEAPAVAETSTGTALVGRITRGDVWASGWATGESGFGDARRLSRGGGDSSLTLAAGPRGAAIAAWTSGIAAQSLQAARYTP